MFREGAERSGRERFSCSLRAWDFINELGRTFGWRPKGTTYVEPPGRKGPTPAPRNYQPGEAQDRKWIETRDVHGWAEALRVARGSQYFDAMIATHCGSQPGSVESKPERLTFEIDQFIEFCRGGAFEFSIKDSESSEKTGD